MKQKIFKHKYATLTLYQGKPIKNVLVLSTMHSSVTVRHVLDQRARMYTKKTSSRS